MKYYIEYVPQLYIMQTEHVVTHTFNATLFDTLYLCTVKNEKINNPETPH